jgi:hypothetical protein
MDIYDPNEWRRRGRGRELQFFATDKEIVQFFQALPTEWGPYYILTIEPVAKNGHRYRYGSFVNSLDEWLSSTFADL